MDTKRPNRDELVSLRCQLTVQQIAAKLSVAKTTVEKWLTKYGIKYHEAHYGYVLPDKLTFFQTDIITGNLLGDGSIPYSKGNRNFSFQFVQKAENEEYVRFIHKTMLPFSRKMEFSKDRKPTIVDGKIVHLETTEDWCYSAKFKTATRPVFTRLREKWYVTLYEKGAKKIIPSDLKLNWRIVSIWFCDDGNNWIPNKSLTFYTDCFSKDEVEFLIYRFKEDLGISALRLTHNDKPIIKIDSGHYFRFLDKVRRYIPWDCMKYKVANEE